MVATALQKMIMRYLAPLRSESSYFAGGVVLNRDWPRRSDDIDIFHDTDEEIIGVAQRDIAALEAAGFSVRKEVETFGCVEAVVSRYGESTLIQWMSETRRRFFPLIRDPEWGARLHDADLAVNKVLAASARRKARDFVDLVSISRNYCPLGPLVMAAAGKPPNFSPEKYLDEILRRGLSIDAADLTAVRGMPSEWTADFIRNSLIKIVDDAKDYCEKAPIDVTGLLAVDNGGRPVEVTADKMQNPDIHLRQATEEPEPLPTLGDPHDPEWGF